MFIYRYLSSFTSSVIFICIELLELAHLQLIIHFINLNMIASITEKSLATDPEHMIMMGEAECSTSSALAGTATNAGKSTIGNNFHAPVY